MRKYKIGKRHKGDGTDHAWDTETWPWFVRYPGGGSCICFSHESAVRVMDGALRQLRCARDEYRRQQLRNQPGWIE